MIQASAFDLSPEVRSVVATLPRDPAVPLSSRSTEPPTSWLLVGTLPGQDSIARTPLIRFPFRIGRDPASDLVLASSNVSKRHAELLHGDSIVFLRDLGSTNGTFVNGRRVTEPTPVDERDLIQFADVELRLARQTFQLDDQTAVSAKIEQGWLISRMHEVVNERRFTIHFQPIVTGPRREILGYEALVRSDVEGLQSPLALFAAAKRLGLEERLSQLCRQEAVRLLDESGLPGVLFLNTHPHEYLGQELIEELRGLRSRSQRPLVLEIHEEAVSDLETIREFKARLHELDVRLAFDDFGAGQSRLLELAKVLPDYVKFDRSLVKDLGSPSAVQTGLVRSLHDQAAALGIATLAEGIETPESIAACDDIGFTHFQGFAFGRPQPTSVWKAALLSSR